MLHATSPKASSTWVSSSSLLLPHCYTIMKAVLVSSDFCQHILPIHVALQEWRIVYNQIVKSLPDPPSLVCQTKRKKTKMERSVLHQLNSIRSHVLIFHIVKVSIQFSCFHFSKKKKKNSNWEKKKISHWLKSQYCTLILSGVDQTLI